MDGWIRFPQGFVWSGVSKNNPVDMDANVLTFNGDVSRALLFWHVVNVKQTALALEKVAYCTCSQDAAERSQTRFSTVAPPQGDFLEAIHFTNPVSRDKAISHCGDEVRDLPCPHGTTCMMVGPQGLSR
jgi:hypothetical protein